MYTKNINKVLRYPHLLYLEGLIWVRMRFNSLIVMTKMIQKTFKFVLIFEAIFHNNARRKNKALLLDVTIVNPCQTSTLENAARHAGKYLADAVQRKKTSTGARLPSPTSSFLSLCRRVVRLAQMWVSSSRSSSSDVYDRAQVEGTL